MPYPERQLIATIRRAAKLRSSALVTGIGDDCAVLRIPRGHELLVTTDFSLEGVHFRREWHPAASVGHRCLTRGLSDIAAMGGQPLAAFLSLALPSDLDQSWADEFLKGLLALARRHKVPLAGGDIAQSLAGVLADITVLGSVPKGRAVLRSTARAGDLIYVTGSLGASAAIIEALYAGLQLHRPDAPPSSPQADHSDAPPLSRSDRVGTLDAHFYPQPQIAIGRYLRENRLATAMIDISDGLSTDLSHICEESHVGAIIQETAIPLAKLNSPRVHLRHALHGGDDYQLLFTARPKTKVPRRIAGVTITQIGEITRRRQLLIRSADGSSRELKSEGWQHFQPDQSIRQ
jgi:thiamine-monophosphate kinase